MAHRLDEAHAPFDGIRAETWLEADAPKISAGLRPKIVLTGRITGKGRAVRIKASYMAGNGFVQVNGSTAWSLEAVVTSQRVSSNRPPHQNLSPVGVGTELIGVKWQIRYDDAQHFRALDDRTLTADVE